jgi:predicted nucleic acid-binding protein
MIVMDSMAVIHLAKLTLLEKCCTYFDRVIIPRLVHREVLAGKKKGCSEVIVIENLIRNKKILVRRVLKKEYLKKANSFNIQHGEAEAVSLYWQEKADYLVTDDDNVRKKRVLLGLRLVGTPAIILTLFIARAIDEVKFKESLEALREIGWFSDAVIDKVLMEGEEWKKRLE